MEHADVDPAMEEEEEDDDGAPVEAIVLRTEPLYQQSASPADIDRGTRLIQSCRDGDLGIVQRQISEGAPAGFMTKTGWTPVAAAAYSGNADVVRYLLAIGADGMYVKSSKRHSVFSTITREPNQGNENSSTSHHLKSSSASAESLDEVGHSNSDHHLSNGDSSSSNGNGSATSLGLMSASPTKSKAVANGINSPLHWACYKGHAEIVTILLHAGYGLEDADPIGNRCLHLACSGGHREVIEILLANAATIGQRNRYGNRPLDLVTDPGCRKLLQRFESHTTCEWCKESFSKFRRPSLCQHCHNIYCDVKPCSSITEIHTAVELLRPGTASTSAVVRAMRYCQECASEMGKTEQDLRNVLDTKLEIIQSTLRIIQEASHAAPPHSSRPPTQAAQSRPTTSTAVEAANGGDPAGGGDSMIADAGAGVSEMDGVEPPRTATSDDGEQAKPRRRLLTNEAIFRALTLSQTDAEALYTAIEAAQLKAVDRELIQRAKQTYHRLVAHVALQEEIKALMVVRPIGVRSLVEPLKTALLRARRESVDTEMLMLGVQVIRSAEAECTLFGCQAMCAKIELGTKIHRREIARFEASIDEAQRLGVNDKLLTASMALRDRLSAEVQLEACLQPFTPLSTTTDAGVEVVHGYRFEDGTEVPTLLQALELRNQRIQAAVDAGSAVEGVASNLLEDGANILKQLKKDIKDEAKAEEERRRLEEEAAAKAAKKGKKKKA